MRDAIRQDCLPSLADSPLDDRGDHIPISNYPRACLSRRWIGLINSWSLEEPIVAFVDADVDTDSYAPKDVLIGSRIQLVIISPPKSWNQKWTTQYGTLVKLYITDLWSAQELFLTGLAISLCV